MTLVWLYAVRALFCSYGAGTSGQHGSNFIPGAVLRRPIQIFPKKYEWRKGRWKRSLKATFYTAIQDDCIRKNQFDFQLNTVLEDNTEPKEPLGTKKPPGCLCITHRQPGGGEFLRLNFHQRF